MTVTQYPPAESILTTLTWVKTAGSAITSLSGNDDTGQSLAYTPGQEQVYLNGVLLTRGIDYIATTGNTITGLSGITSGDNLKVYAASNYSLAAFPAASITGSIANSQLANNAITVNGVSIPLGGSVTAGAINSIVAGTGLTGGGTTGTVTIGLNPAYTIPSQSGYGGYLLSTDGNNLYWTNSNVIPSQAGNGGRYLQTNGTTLSWQLAATQTAGNTFTTTQTISPSTNTQALIINGSSAQTNDLIQVKDYNGNSLINVASNGNLNFPNYISSGKNIFVNGGFDVWARGTSATFTGTYQYLADKWIHYADSGTVTASQIAVSGNDGLPAGVKYALRTNRTAGATADRFLAIYVIEGATAYIGKSLTLSYYIRLGSGINQVFASNLSTRVGRFGAATDVSSTTFPTTSLSTSTFTRVSHTINVTSSTLSAGADLFELEVGVTQGAGTNTYFDIAAVMLEVGNQATPYARCTPTVATEQLACMRYYQPLALPGLDANIAPVVRESATSAVWNYNLPVPMRATPTLSYYTNGSPNASPTIGRMVFRDTSFNVSAPAITGFNLYGSTNQYMLTLGITHSSVAGTYVYSEWDTLNGNAQIGLFADY